MGAEMIKIDWVAPIVPGLSLAGVDLGTTLEEFKISIGKYCVGSLRGLYEFSGAPPLLLSISESAEKAYFRFEIFDLNLTGWNLQFPGSAKVLSETRALVVAFLEGKVSSVSVWMFDYFDSMGVNRLAYSYQGA